MDAFEDLFGRPPAVRADAPGRLNLIGEHTDYNGGFVLPVALPLHTAVELAPRADRRVRAASASLGGGPTEYTLGKEAPRRGWLDYVQGLTRTLRADGHPLAGFDLRVASSVPMGAGLASSAALEVAVLRALRQAFALPLDDEALARVGQRAESEFVGARVGIMDQMAASLADERSALFLDTRSLAHRRVPLPAGGALVVLDSGVTHRHAAGAYNARRAECERSCTLLGVAQLRDLDPGNRAPLDALPATLRRRVRHVVTENERVLAAVAALQRDDLAALGALLCASHASLRDDYEVSTPELDRIVELAAADADVYGARLTGGGFGGAVVVLARTGTGPAVAQRIARAYRRRALRVLLPAVCGKT